MSFVLVGLYKETRTRMACIVCATPTICVNYLFRRFLSALPDIALTMLFNTKALLLTFAASAPLAAAVDCGANWVLATDPPPGGQACQGVRYCEGNDLTDSRCTLEYPILRGGNNCMKLSGNGPRGNGAFKVSAHTSSVLNLAVDMTP